jgi:hypothetical protein
LKQSAWLFEPGALLLLPVSCGLWTCAEVAGVALDCRLTYGGI